MFTRMLGTLGPVGRVCRHSLLPAPALHCKVQNRGKFGGGGVQTPQLQKRSTFEKR